MRKIPTITVAILLSGAGSLALHAAPSDAEGVKFFETRIRPVLAENCFKCHGEKKQKAGMRLDKPSFILKGSTDGPVLVPGDPEASHLMRAISYTDPDLQMPPDDKKLPESQIADIRKWIEMGAPIPEDEVVQGGVAGEFSEEDRSWWSFQPLAKVSPPAIAPNAGVVKNDVDRFIIAKLSEAGLPQAPEAKPEELVRRLYFNLHGLPPTEEQLRAYLDDTRPDSYERLVEELLASPRYGQRWAQHWLDLARYAESDGYREDAYRPHAWPYRDYVIRAFNDDKPYDQFVREQLAGDEIDPENPDVLVATGFLRHGIYEWNQADAEMQREIIETELADVTSEVFLGLSVGCAKCHDHKFDPILHQDYYRMRAFFAPLQWRDDLPLAEKEEIARHRAEVAAWEEESREAREAWEAAIVKPTASGRKKALAYFPAEVQEMMAKPEEERSPYEKQIAYLVERRMAVEIGRSLNGFKGKSPEWEAYKPFAESKPQDLQPAFVATDVGTEAPPTVMKTRRSETVIEPGFLTILAPGDLKVEPLKDLNSTGRRTALANWLTSPENPLSTRVIVNRVWQYHFGRALSVHTSDFGRLGEAPTHPELLDWLTTGFIENGWSIKWLHRQMVNSATYRQSSMVTSTAHSNEVDPENKLLWRMRPQRLDAEQARDALLALGGDLKATDGGPSADSSQPVPSIFVRKRRNSPDEFLSRFDAPPGFQSVAKRETTNTALQSLMMVNGEWPLQRAKAIAARLLKRNPGADTPTLAAKAFALVYGRPADPQESAAATDFIEKHKELVAGERPKEKEVTLESPLAAAEKYFGSTVPPGEQSVVFKPGSEYQSIEVKGAKTETQEFTVEATVNLDSIYPDSSVRTLASRWNGDQATAGWAIGVTGVKSRYKPGSLIVLITGDDFQGALVYEVVASGIEIPLNKPHHITTVFSNETLPGQTFGGNITFHVKDLSDANSPVQTVRVPHGLGSGFVNPDRKLLISGRDTQTHHYWSGAIHRLEIRDGITQPGAAPFTANEPPLVSLSGVDFSSAETKHFAWIKPSGQSGVAKARPAQHEALGDLFHALINSNEFLYLP